MSDSTMTVDECRELTRKQFGDEIDYCYITEELLAADAKLGDEVIISKGDEFRDYYGNNPRLEERTINGVRIRGTLVDYDRDGSIGNGCGSSKSGWFNPNEWVQESFGRCPNGRFQIRFS